MDSLANFSFTNPKISLSGKGGGGGGFLFVEKCSVRLISGRFGDRSNVGVEPILTLVLRIALV